MALGVSGTVRRFAVPAFEPNPKTDVTTTGWGVSVDLLLPIIAASATAHDNALTFTGSFARGEGISDLYTGLGGPPFPALPNPAKLSPAPTYTASIDPGLVGFDAAGNLQAVSYQTFIVGLQYWFPGKTGLSLAGNYSHLQSFNAAALANGATPQITEYHYRYPHYDDVEHSLLGFAEVDALEYGDASQESAVTQWSFTLSPSGALRYKAELVLTRRPSGRSRN